MPANSKWRIRAGRSAVADPHGGAPWEDALNQADDVNEEGELVTGLGPQLANPARRFGVQRGEKLSAVGGLRKCHAKRAAAVQTPVDLPTWDHFQQFLEFPRKRVPRVV